MKRNSKLGLLSILFLLPLAGRATDGSWSNDASGNWSNSTNWNAGNIAGGTSGRAFFTNAITASRTVTNDVTGLVIGGLTFAPGSTNVWTLTGKPIALTVTNGSPTVTVSSAGATIGNLLSGTQGFVKLGTGTVWIAGNDTFTGAGSVLAGSLAVTGGVMNASVGLAAGTMFTALWGPGIAGDYYYTGQATNQTNFATFVTFESCNAQLNPSQLFNGPQNGTVWDFGSTGTNFPPGTPAANFEARWEGKFNAVTNGTYYFDTTSDDGNMLWIDGTNYINSNFAQGMTLRSATVGLTAGLHDIVFQY